MVQHLSCCRSVGNGSNKTCHEIWWVQTISCQTSGVLFRAKMGACVLPVKSLRASLSVQPFSFSAAAVSSSSNCCAWNQPTDISSRLGEQESSTHHTRLVDLVAAGTEVMTRHEVQGRLEDGFCEIDGLLLGESQLASGRLTRVCLPWCALKASNQVRVRRGDRGRMPGRVNLEHHIDTSLHVNLVSRLRERLSENSETAYVAGELDYFFDVFLGELLLGTVRPFSR